MAEMTNNQSVTPVRRVPVGMPPEFNDVNNGRQPTNEDVRRALEGMDTPLPMPDEDTGGVEVEGTPEQIQRQQMPPQPLDMFALQEELDAEGITPTTTMQEVEPTEVPEEKPQVSVFNVPQGEAETFMQTLPIDTYKKVSTSKSVQVNEVELVDVPVATRRIQDLADYRSLVRSRRESRPVNVTERVLINSGMVVTLKPASSIEMATIYRNYLTGTDTDYSKLYQFCYDHTIGTSIGDLSYNEYVNQISPSDIETILDGIYEISETDERTIRVVCGTGEGGCGQEYDIKVSVKTLADVKELSKESIDRAKEIVNARNDIQRARQIHEDSPVMKVKILKFGDRYLYIRSANGPMAIERGDMIEQIMEERGAIIGVLVSYIEKITVMIQERPDTEPIPIDLTTVDVISDELMTFTDDELDQLKTAINNYAKEYATLDFSLKGDFQCPHCKNKKNKIPCRISDLIFQKVQRMLR